MLKRFFLITLMFLVIAFFISPFVIIYLISIGYPEEIVDYMYWGVVSIIWLIIIIIGFIDWRLEVRNDKKLRNND